MRTGSLVGARSRSTSIRTCVAASVSSPGTSITSIALGRQVLLDRRQELLDLLGGEVVDRDGFQQVLGRDEAALAALGDELLLDLVEGRAALASRAGTLIGGPGGSPARPPQCTEAAHRRVTRSSQTARARRRPRPAPGTARRSRHRSWGSASGAARGARRCAPSARTPCRPPTTALAYSGEGSPSSGSTVERRRPAPRAPGRGRPRSRRDVPPGVAQRDEQRARFGERGSRSSSSDAASSGVGVAAREQPQHLALDPLAGGAALHRGRRPPRAAAEAPRRATAARWLCGDPGEVGEQPRVLGAAHRIGEPLEQRQRVGDRRGLPLDRGQVVALDRAPDHVLDERPGRARAASRTASAPCLATNSAGSSPSGMISTTAVTGNRSWNANARSAARAPASSESNDEDRSLREPREQLEVLLPQRRAARGHRVVDARLREPDHVGVALDHERPRRLRATAWRARCRL